MFTLGGFFIWQFIDLIRMSDLVNEANLKQEMLYLYKERVATQNQNQNVSQQNQNITINITKDMIGDKE